MDGTRRLALSNDLGSQNSHRWCGGQALACVARYAVLGEHDFRTRQTRPYRQRQVSRVEMDYSGAGFKRSRCGEEKVEMRRTHSEGADRDLEDSRSGEVYGRGGEEAR